MDSISKIEQEVSRLGNTAHVLNSQGERSIRAAKSQGGSPSSRAFCASVTLGISDTTLNTYIQDLLSEVIKQLLPLDLMKSVPKTIKGLNKLLKNREDPHIIGHLENKVDHNDMLKLMQSMTHTKNGLFASAVKIKVDVISKLLWVPSKDQIFTTEVSKISINEIQIKQKTSLADPVKKNMQFMLWTILIDVIYQCTQLVADLLNVSFTTMLNSAAPTGTFEAIQYDLTGSPMVTEKHFLVPYQATFKVSLPGRPPATTPFHVMPHSGTNLHMVLSKDFISYGIAAMTGGSRATLNKEAGEKWFMTTALTNAIPKTSEHFPAPQPMVIQTRGSTFPLVSMDSQSIKVKQGLFTEVLVRGQTVLHLEVSITFQARLSASNGKLFITLSQNSFDIVQASSSVRSTNVQKLHDYINDVYTNRFLPIMNGMLRRGIVLPCVLNIKCTNLNIALSEGGMVISM